MDSLDDGELMATQSGDEVDDQRDDRGVLDEGDNIPGKIADNKEADPICGTPVHHRPGDMDSRRCTINVRAAPSVPQCPALVTRKGVYYEGGERDHPHFVTSCRAARSLRGRRARPPTLRYFVQGRAQLAARRRRSWRRRRSRRGSRRWCGCCSSSSGSSSAVVVLRNHSAYAYQEGTPRRGPS